MADSTNVEPRSSVGAPAENEAAPERCSGASGSAGLLDRLRTLLIDVRSAENPAWADYMADVSKTEWAALHRCGNKLEDAIGALQVIAPNDPAQTRRLLLRQSK